MALIGAAPWVVTLDEGGANSCRTDAERDQCIQTLRATGHAGSVYRWTGERYELHERIEIGSTGGER